MVFDPIDQWIGSEANNGLGVEGSIVPNPVSHGLVAAVGSPRYSGNHLENLKDLISKYDINNDGELDRDEFILAGGSKQDFDLVDSK